MLNNKPIYLLPKYELTWPAGWSLAIGLLGVGALSFASLHFAFGVFFLAYLVLGIGMWQEQRWAAWGGLIYFGLSAGLRLIGLFIDFRWKHVGFFVGFVSLAWSCWDSLKLMNSADESDGDDSPLFSLVLLQRSHKYLEDVLLAKIVSSAWGGNYSSGDESSDAEKYVVGESPLFIVGADGATFLVHNHDGTYWEDMPSLLENVPDLRLHKALEEHSAWLSVDAIGCDEEATPADYYPQIAKLIAELADEETLAVHRPESGEINVWSEELATNISSPEGYETLGAPQQVPVIPVPEDDPAMAEAVREAQQRWPEFQAAFKEQDADHSNFSVKAKLTIGDDTEFIWLEVIGLEPHYIHGKLANDPVSLGDLTLGSQVEVPLKDMWDWCYCKGDELIGLFSREAIAQAAASYEDSD